MEEKIKYITDIVKDCGMVLTNVRNYYNLYYDFATEEVIAQSFVGENGYEFTPLKECKKTHIMLLYKELLKDFS